VESVRRFFNDCIDIVGVRSANFRENSSVNWRVDDERGPVRSQYSGTYRSAVGVGGQMQSLENGNGV
jgi:hypothetical protein